MKYEFLDADVDPDRELVSEAKQITEGDHVSIVQSCLARYEYWCRRGEKEVAQVLASVLRYEIDAARK